MLKLWKWLCGLFSGSMKKFLESVFTAAKTEIITALKDIAIQAVIEAQVTGLSNEEKRKKAFEKIKFYAVARGIKAGDSLINLILEMAVQSIKGA